jgi:hypothetical protein
MAYEKDVESVDAIINALYAVISGPAGPKDWDRERYILHPTARMMRGLPPGEPPADPPTPNLRIFSGEQFIEQVTSRLLAEDFYEYETGREEFRFGRWVYAVSAYASARGMDQPPFARGINGIQLWFDAGRWWVMSVIWDWAGGENRIPARLLEKVR